MNLEYLAKALIYMGIGAVVLGVLLYFGSRLGIGRLPGDIYIRKGNFTFYFPLVTCILLSVLLSVIMRIIRR